MKVDRSFLQKHALFGGINDAEIDAIIPMLKEETYSEGDFIILENTDGDRLHFIISGHVEVLKKAGCPQSPEFKQLAVLGPGDSFGEMELIDIQKRSASIRAMEDVTALSLTNKDMYQLYHSDIKTYTMVVLNIAREISRRLRHMDQLFADTLFSLPCPEPDEGPAPTNH